MKKWLLPFLIITSSYVYSQDIGSLGDVKYSILKPAQFRTINGSSWVLMDGRNITGTDLSNEIGISNIPDARGVFIRGMNLDRNDGKGDPDGNRGVGKYQQDQFKNHVHPYKDQFDINEKNNHTRGSNARDINYKDDQRNTLPSTLGGKETRPKNIALYTYIKINRK